MPSDNAHIEAGGSTNRARAIAVSDNAWLAPEADVCVCEGQVESATVMIRLEVGSGYGGVWCSQK
jgi:hypothetical protein